MDIFILFITGNQEGGPLDVFQFPPPDPEPVQPVRQRRGRRLRGPIGPIDERPGAQELYSNRLDHIGQRYHQHMVCFLFFYF